MTSQTESDELFAQRLQAQEMGAFAGNSNMDVQTPLVVRISSQYPLQIY